MRNIKHFFCAILMLSMSVSLFTGCAQDTAVAGSSVPASSVEALPESSAEAVSESSSDTVSSDDDTSSEQSYPESFMLESENVFDYQTGLECAAFSSAYVLRHFGEEAKGMKLFETYPSKVDDRGVPPYGIETFFIRRGYDIKYICNGTVEDLKAEVSKGVPVIVFIHTIEPYTDIHATHYIPLVGYDKEYLYFSESLPEFANCKDEKDVKYNRKTEIEKFKRLWKNIDGLWDYPYFVISEKSSAASE